MLRFMIVNIAVLISAILADSQAIAQISPFQYKNTRKQLASLSPHDELFSRLGLIVREQERQLEVFFRKMPAVDPMVLSDSSISSSPTTKLELELRRSGVSIDKNGPRLVLQMYHNPTLGRWSSSLKIHEYVTLDRQDSGRLDCVTYKDEGPYRTTKEQAEDDMWGLLNEFCLLYMKFSNPQR